jgi:NAD(P)-dependent dehydrogenase (short-subunit alcohol dehydrogenase family)
MNAVAIVTGAGSGFGAAIAKKLAANGVHVVVADIASQKKTAASSTRLQLL